MHEQKCWALTKIYPAHVKVNLDQITPQMNSGAANPINRQSGLLFARPTMVPILLFGIGFSAVPLTREYREVEV